MNEKGKAVRSTKYNIEYYKNKNHGYDEFLNGYNLLPQFDNFIFSNIKKGDKVLDVGCGRGEIIIRCKSKGIDCTGIDYSSSAIKICMKALRDNKINQEKALVMNAKKLSFKDNKFDAVIMMDVVEHLHDWELNVALREAHRVLKVKGKILVHTSPNKNNMKVLRFIASLIKVKFASDEFHVNEQTPKKLIQTLSPLFTIKSLTKVKDKRYFSNQVSKRGSLVKLLFWFVDAIYDSKLFDYAMKNDLISEYLSTDIYVVATKNK